MTQQSDWLARWLDDEPPGVEEAVLAALDAMRDYRRLLKSMIRDAYSEEDYNPTLAKGMEKELGPCDEVIRSLEGWGLDVSLGGLIKPKLDLKDFKPLPWPEPGSRRSS